MRYSKISPTRTPHRKFAHPDRLAASHSFPAWIDSGTGIPFPSVAAVSQRVRDSLVLRLVAKRHHRELADARCVR